MWKYLKHHLNFYRIHLLLFTLVPLVFAMILWASNGRFPIHFIDALFICISAVTGTGLVTVDLSSLTAWQQAIIAILELIGNQAFVCWVVVFVRRRYYRKHLEPIVAAEIQKYAMRRDTMMSEVTPSLRRFRETILRGSAALKPPQSDGMELRIRPTRASPAKIRPDMVRRVDIAPHRINPTGMQMRLDSVEPHVPNRVTVQSPANEERAYPPSDSSPFLPEGEALFGGFPWPPHFLTTLFRRMFPRLHRGMHRTITMPRTETLIPHHSNHEHDPSGGAIKHVPYFSFTAIVGRNSAFQGLTEDNIAELGGVEYRALNSLLWIVPLYYFGSLAISMIIITPYMCLPQWKSNFVPPQQHRKISAIWFSIFQIVGAWANTGMSLVDQNMVPFRKAYLLIVVLIYCVWAGNTAFPIFLRFTIWIFSKLLPDRSRTRESLVFLLHHPRRCFITLFPARQTWLLFGIVILMNTVLWVGDLVLNINNPATEAIPVGTRIILAFLQAAAVRSAGFTSIATSAMAPAVQVLYVVMMYIAIYPIAMSVRSTNVYEERSLGIYPRDTIATERQSDSGDNRIAIWGKYLLRHTRRQLSFDMWWLALSLFLLCVVERNGLMNTENATWFNIFALIFELVSAYGTVGLSLGIPTANYSLSGALHTLSKLILCAVMLRGRHRGLPVALDRAVMLPHEFCKRSDEKSLEEAAPATQNSQSERGSIIHQDTESTSGEPAQGMMDGEVSGSGGSSSQGSTTAAETVEEVPRVDAKKSPAT